MSAATHHLLFRFGRTPTPRHQGRGIGASDTEAVLHVVCLISRNSLRIDVNCLSFGARANLEAAETKRAAYCVKVQACSVSCTRKRIEKDSTLGDSKVSIALSVDSYS